MTLIAKNKTQAAELGREMREDLTESLSRRRKAAGLCLTSIASLGVIALYQTGVLKHLPDPPAPGFDADKVHGSAQAYQFLSVPDAVLAIGSYTVTLGLAAMGGANRATEHPWIPVAAAAKATADSLVSAKLTTDQATKHHAFSLWSLLVAGATFAALTCVIPEARDAVHRLAQRD